MNDRVSVDVRDGVADVRLLRGDKMNALDGAMFEALLETGERLKSDKGVRAVVLSGEGRAFCAGLDMDSVQAMLRGDSAGFERAIGGPLLPKERLPSGANRPQQAALVWREIPVPVIAAVQGVAFGGGFQLALGCDLRFVAPDARMSLMEIRWGLVPDMCGMALLRRLVRDDVARELTWSGRIVPAEEAVRIGLATRVCEDPRAEALAFAREVAGKNPHAIRAGKRLLDLMVDGDQASVLLAESIEQTALLGTANQLEAVQANLEKREPRFID